MYYNSKHISYFQRRFKMNGFEKRRELKKNSILYSALELFKQYGYNRVSIAEIAKKAAVSQVSIYNFFNSKENLKLELIKKIMFDHYNDLINIVNQNEPVKSRFEKLFATRIAFFRNISGNFVIEAMNSAPNILENIFHDLYEKFTTIFLNLFEEGQKEGVLSNSISPSTLNMFIDILFYYFSNNQDAVKQLDTNPHITEEIISLFFTALTKE